VEELSLGSGWPPTAVKTTRGQCIMSRDGAAAPAVLWMSTSASHMKTPLLSAAAAGGKATAAAGRVGQRLRYRSDSPD